MSAVANSRVTRHMMDQMGSLLNGIMVRTQQQQRRQQLEHRRHIFKATFFIVFIYSTLQIFAVLSGVRVYEEVSESATVTQEAFVPGQPKSVIILGYQRSGSTFFGEMFNTNPDVFYLFEPLDALYTSLYGTSPGWNVPSDITSLPDGAARTMPEFERAAVNEFLRRVFDCDVDRLPTEFLVHYFWLLFPDEFAASRNYVDCLGRSNLSTFDCYAIVQPFCGMRLNDQSEQRHRECFERLSSTFADGQRKNASAAAASTAAPSQLSNNVSRIFANYSTCLSEVRGRAERGRCVRTLSENCSARRLRAAKVVRATMAGIEPLLDRMPNLRVVHLVRDPRAVILSRTQFTSSGSGAYSLGFHDAADAMTAEARLYCRQVAADLAASRRIRRRHPGRVATVSYEDFARSPARWTVAVYRWLNETAPVETVSKMWRLAVEGQRRLSGDELAQYWQKQLTYDVAERIARQCPDLMELLYTKNRISDDNIIDSTFL